MTKVTSAVPFLQPLRRSVRLSCSVDAAFRAFTENIAAWWPLSTHSVGQERAATCRFEPGVGGHLIEEDVDGNTSIWAEISAWEPPHRFVLLWHPGLPPSRAQEVEVQFLPDADGTLVELEHRGWQQTPEEQLRRGNYDSGWRGILEDRFHGWVRTNEAAWRNAGAT